MLENKFSNKWDYAIVVVWSLIITTEIRGLINDPSRIVSYLIIFMGIGIIILNIRSIVKHIKVKRSYEKAKNKLFDNEKPKKKKNFWYKLHKFFTIATPAISDEVDEMLDNKDGRKIIFDMIESDRKERKNQ